MGFFSNIGKERRVMRNVDKMIKENGVTMDNYFKEQYTRDLETAKTQEDKERIQRALDECNARIRKNSR